MRFQRFRLCYYMLIYNRLIKDQRGRFPCVRWRNQSFSIDLLLMRFSPNCSLRGPSFHFPSSLATEKKGVKGEDSGRKWSSSSSTWRRLAIYFSVNSNRLNNINAWTIRSATVVINPEAMIDHLYLIVVCFYLPWNLSLGKDGTVPSEGKAEEWTLKSIPTIYKFKISSSPIGT